MGLLPSVSKMMATMSTGFNWADIYTYSTNATHANVTNWIGKNISTEPVLPKLIESKQVEAVSATVFNGKQALTYCNIEKGATFLGNSMDNAFNNCRNLIGVNSVPNGITTMNNSFRNCINLTSSPALPNTVQYMNYCYLNCVNLTEVPDVPDSVISLFHAYEGTGLINPPNIPNTVANVGAIFAQCSDLVAPASLPNVNYCDNVYNNCRSLNNAGTIPNNASNMVYMYRNCIKLTTCPVIPNKMAYMTNAFQDCVNITSSPRLNAPVFLQYTFFNCRKITSAGNIGSNLQSGTQNMFATFRNCVNLTGTINIFCKNVVNAVNCFYGTTKAKTVKVHAGTNTFNSFNAIYGGGANGVTLQTF